MSNTVYVCPVINTMGPAVDSKAADILSDWAEVDCATSKYFSDEFRRLLLDSSGCGVKISWFPISWSGFKTNPVNRDFGWFNIYDHMYQRWAKDVNRYGDGVYWMYNHPDKSGVGNCWGLDWLYGCNYLDILARMVIDKGYFPAVVEIPTADVNSENFIENYFPFSLSNRNSRHINWNNIEADGKLTREVLKWEDAPLSWEPYHPSIDNHQVSGGMKHLIFRLLDIKTRIMSFPADEIESAFEAASIGRDVIIAGYEHDFRDRADAVSELFLTPIDRIARKYKSVRVVNSNYYDAAIKFLCKSCVGVKPEFSLSLDCGYICVRSSERLFGYSPFVAIKDSKKDKYLSMGLIRNGMNVWLIQRELLPDEFIIGIAGFSECGIKSVSRFYVRGMDIDIVLGGGYQW